MFYTQFCLQYAFYSLIGVQSQEVCQESFRESLTKIMNYQQLYVRRSFIKIVLIVEVLSIPMLCN